MSGAVQQLLDRFVAVDCEASRHAEAQTQGDAFAVIARSVDGLIACSGAPTEVEQQQLSDSANAVNHTASNRRAERGRLDAALHEPRIGREHALDLTSDSTGRSSFVDHDLDDLGHSCDASEMSRRTIAGFTVATVGLGCNNFGTRLDDRATTAVVHAALDAGVDLFDTAEVYGNGLSETFLGAALGRRRDDVIIATKFGFATDDQGVTGGHPDRVRESIDASLRRLDTDWIDIFQLHRPDPHVPLHDTLGALDEQVVKGKVRAVGVSDFDADLLGEAHDVAAERNLQPIATVQHRFSVLHTSPLDEIGPACAELDIGLLPYFPLESGLLTGKVTTSGPPAGSRLHTMDADRRRRFIDDHRIDRARVLASYASRHGRTLLELAISWLLHHDVVPSVISGATTAEQVRANVAAAGWAMTDDIVGEIAEIVAVAPPRSSERDDHA